MLDRRRTRRISLRRRVKVKTRRTRVRRELPPPLGALNPADLYRPGQ